MIEVVMNIEIYLNLQFYWQFLINCSGLRLVKACVCYFLSNFYFLSNGLETRAVFFDISKAFDKVWHEDLLFKLSPIFIIRESQELF